MISTMAHSPECRCLYPMQYPPVMQARAPQGMSGILDDVECAVSQAEQRLKGIIIGVIVGAGLAVFLLGNKVRR